MQVQSLVEASRACPNLLQRSGPRRLIPYRGKGLATWRKEAANIPSHLARISMFLCCDGRHLDTYLRWAFLHGTHAEATCPFVFLWDLGEANDCWLSCVGGREVMG